MDAYLLAKCSLIDKLHVENDFPIYFQINSTQSGKADIPECFVAIVSDFIVAFSYLKTGVVAAVVDGQWSVDDSGWSVHGTVHDSGWSVHGTVDDSRWSLHGTVDGQRTIVNGQLR